MLIISLSDEPVHHNVRDYGFSLHCACPSSVQLVFHTKWPFLSIFNFEINHEISINFNETLELSYLRLAQYDELLIFQLLSVVLG